jgi:hypothetical protein
LILRNKKLKILFFVVGALVSVQSCGTSSRLSDEGGCGDNTALIGVFDGFLQLMCGCDEADGTRNSPPQKLSCTVKKGSHVLFQYMDVRQDHQIKSTGSPSFLSSPLVGPEELESQGVHSVTFSTLGTYDFEDAVDQGAQGRIIVR